MAPLASTCGNRIWVVVVVALVIVKISIMIKFGIGVVRKIVRSSGVLLSIVLNRRRKKVGKKRLEKEITYPNVTLNDIVNVARTILIKFQVMTRSFL
jgi:uncharacterized membrane protein